MINHSLFILVKAKQLMRHTPNVGKFGRNTNKHPSEERSFAVVLDITITKDSKIHSFPHFT